MQAVYERELRAWQENAGAQLRTVIPAPREDAGAADERTRDIRIR